MAGYVGTTSEEELYKGYSSGRAFWRTSPKFSGFAQWSAVNDSSTCDFCGWADERTFPHNIGSGVTPTEWDPPVHWGCRCIVGYILKEEFDPGSGDWGKGPPPSAFPPGTSGGYRRGKPTLRSLGKKPKSPFQDRAKQAAENWEHGWFGWGYTAGGHRTGISGILGTKRKVFREWWETSMRTVMGDSYIENQAVNVRLLVSSWVSSSSQQLKKVIETISRGTADDVLKALDEWGVLWPGTQVKTVAQAEALQLHWEGNRRLAIEAAKKTGLVNSDDTITLYRGVSTKTPSSGGGVLADVKSKLLAGDTEFAVSTSFVESWSASLEVASTGFGDLVFMKRVSVDDLATGFFEHPQFVLHAEEAEVIWYNWDKVLVPKSVDSLAGSGSKLLVEVH